MTPKNKVKYICLEFDDFVKDDTGIWSQVCEEHSKHFKPEQLEETPTDKLICGVKGCSKKAKYYVSLKQPARKNIPHVILKGPPCHECTEGLPCNCEDLEECKKKRGEE